MTSLVVLLLILTSPGAHPFSSHPSPVGSWSGVVHTLVVSLVMMTMTRSGRLVQAPSGIVRPQEVPSCTHNAVAVTVTMPMAIDAEMDEGGLVAVEAASGRADRRYVGVASTTLWHGALGAVGGRAPATAGSSGPAEVRRLGAHANKDDNAGADTGVVGVEVSPDYCYHMQAQEGM